MKSLSLSQPLVLMMIGVPGAGKSFFARQFAETFSAPLVSMDKLRITISPQTTYTRDEDIVVLELMKQQITEFIKTKKTFIIDGGLNTRVDRVAIQRFAQEAGYGTLIIWVQTDDPTCKLRAMRRKERNRFDAYNTSLSSEQFVSLSKRLTPPNAQEPFVVISGKHTYPTQAKVILKKLVAPRAEAAASTPISSTTTPQNHETTPPTRRSISIN